MKGYKAFGKGLICRDKQYAENTVFEEEKAEICESGMHFCKKPLDVLNYYPLVDNDGNISEFAEVEALDEPKTDNGKKFCTKKLKIGAKISFAELVQASVNFESEKITDTKNQKTENNNTHINSFRDNAHIGSSGDFAQIGSSGRCAQIGSSGDFAQIGSSGNGAQIKSTGKYAVICCAGENCIAKGKIGSWITLSEWEYNEKEKCNIPICVKTKRIDGIRIKEDTFYKLKNGVFVEVE